MSTNTRAQAKPQRSPVPAVAPPSAHRAVADPGVAPPVAERVDVERRLGRDFSHVRVHSGPRASYAAAELHANAFAVGPHIVLGEGRYRPGTAAFRRLMAHELAHVAQGGHGQPAAPGRVASDDEAEAEAASVANGASAVIRRSEEGLVRRQDAPTADLNQRFTDALANRDWAAAARALAEMTPADRRAGIQALTSEARSRLRDVAMHLDPGSANVVVRDIEAVETARPAEGPARQQPAPQETGPNVAAMTAVQKLERAWELADVSDEARNQLRGLFSPRSLAIMAGFAVLYIAAQLTPAGWAADLVAVVSISFAAFFIGTALFDAVRDMVRFFNAVNATSDAELRAAGHALAHAISLVGITIVMTLLTRGIRGRAPAGGRPLPGPPPEGFVDAVTTEGVVVRMPNAAAEEAGLLQSRSTGGGGPAARSGTPGPRSGAAEPAPAEPAPAEPAPAEPAAGEPAPGPARSTPRPSEPASPPRGEEIWAELTDELLLQPRGTGGARGAARAAADARSGGLVGPQGQSGAVDMAVQSHNTAPGVRGSYGVTGAQMESAHFLPQTIIRALQRMGVRASSGRALTTLLGRTVHDTLDAPWISWLRARRATPNPSATVAEIYEVLLDAINRAPGIPQNVKNAMAWRLQLEMFSELGLQPSTVVPLQP